MISAQAWEYADEHLTWLIRVGKQPSDAIFDILGVRPHKISLEACRGFIAINAQGLIDAKKEERQ